MSVSACVFSFARIYPNSMVASQRIALLVSRELRLPLVTEQNLGDVPRRLDLLLIVNGAYGFCRCLPELGEMIERAGRIVWIQNDYGIIPPKAEGGAESPFRLAFRKRAERGKPHIDYWTTVRPNAGKTPLSSYVNWNALTFRIEHRVAAGDDLLYYGSWRDFGTRKRSRTEYFDRYFKEPRVRVTISSPLFKGKNKFREHFVHRNVAHVDKFEGDIYEELGRHGAGLYLEDVASHSEYHSPPNRFYEMLSAGLPIIFQPECGATLRAAGYDPSPYQARNSLEVERMFAKREEMGLAQRLEWTERASFDSVGVVPSLHAAMAKMEDS